jgi:hypothetical protein
MALRHRETLGVRRETNLRQPDLWSAGPYSPAGYGDGHSDAEMPVTHKLTESAQRGRKPCSTRGHFAWYTLGALPPTPRDISGTVMILVDSLHSRSDQD